MNLYHWLEQLRNGNVNAIRNVLVQLQNEERAAIVMSWKLLRAWPAKYRFSPLNAQGKEILIEILELAFERMEIE